MPQIIVVLDDDVFTKKPIQYTIDDLGDNNFVASVVGANLNASGDTLAEVRVNLMDIIAGMFRLLQRYSDSELSRPYRELRDWLTDHMGFVVDKAD